MHSRTCRWYRAGSQCGITVALRVALRGAATGTPCPALAGLRESVFKTLRDNPPCTVLDLVGVPSLSLFISTGAMPPPGPHYGRTAPIESGAVRRGRPVAGRALRPPGICFHSTPTARPRTHRVLSRRPHWVSPHGARRETPTVPVQRNAQQNGCASLCFACLAGRRAVGAGARLRRPLHRLDRHGACVCFCTTCRRKPGQLERLKKNFRHFNSSGLRRQVTQNTHALQTLRPRVPLPDYSHARDYSHAGWGLRAGSCGAAGRLGDRGARRESPGGRG